MTHSDFDQLWTDAASRHPAYASRIRRAKRLLTDHLADPRKRLIVARFDQREGLTFRVRAGNRAGAYIVTRGGCTCPDARDPKVKQCKHQMAVRVLCRLMQAQLGGAS